MVLSAHACDRDVTEIAQTTFSKQLIDSIKLYRLFFLGVAKFTDLCVAVD